MADFLNKTQVFPVSQKGVTLVELMVGIAIGLLVISVAVGALMVSRNISGTVSDATGIQQQAAYAMRVIGQQVRQAGSLRLNLDPLNSGDDYLIPVALETIAPATGAGNAFDPRINALAGDDQALAVGYRRYQEASYGTAAVTSLSRNCLGGPADSSTDQRVESLFSLNGTDLLCGGNGANAEPIARNVADFQVMYLRQDNSAPSDSKIQRLSAAAVGSNWPQVVGVEVCLVLFGSEPIDVPAGSTYVGCDGANVDMTALAAPRTRRLHLVFRNVFQLRSQGLI